MDYITETLEDRASRLEYENEQLTHQLNSTERHYSQVLAENGRLHAETEELAARMHAMQLKLADVDGLKLDVESLQVSNARMREGICVHSDECFDFETLHKRAQVYLADD